MRRLSSALPRGILLWRATRHSSSAAPKSEGTVAGMPVPGPECARVHELYLLRSDPLHVLGIDPEEANVNLINTQYRVKTLECDMNTKEGQEKAEDIKLAYEILKNPLSAYYHPTKVPMDPVRLRLWLEVMPRKAKMMNGALSLFAMGLLVFMIWVVFRALFQPLTRQRKQLNTAKLQQQQAMEKAST